MTNHSWLPAFVLLCDSGNDMKLYMDALYAFFRSDFVDGEAQFATRSVKPKEGTMDEGKEETFWHIISQMERGSNVRVPEVRRCERIRWPRAILDADAKTRHLKVWRKRQFYNGKEQRRVKIALEDFSYLVVLVEKPSYYLLITAYPVDRNHEVFKLRRDYGREEKLS